MNCPYCHTPLTELAAECPGCQLNLNRAAALLGPIPRLEPGVTDHCQALDARERKQLQRQIHALRQLFPQLKLQVLCHSFPIDHPFELYVFWIHNLGGISSEQEKAGNNHSILLALDPIHHRSAISLGYGLEPFVAPADLDALLEKAAPAWTDQAWAEGIAVVLDGLGAVLDTAIRRIGEAFELDVHPGVARPGDF